MEYENKITDSHNRALKWFLENAGKVIPWTGALDDGTLLFTKAKGIYKPKDSEYALSIRHTPRTLYEDDEPVFNGDGTWFYNYHQEEEEGSKKTSKNLYTNKGLLACMRDFIPVGVAIKISEKPNIKYKILGLANVVGLNNSKFELHSYDPRSLKNTDWKFGPFSINLDELKGPEFIPTSKEDARIKVLREIIQRQGQKKFRATLLEMYNETCVITGCKVQSILEAAHITPYLGINTNHPSNGLLLRADVHTLWDLGLIAIDPLSMRIKIAELLKQSEYACYQNQSLKINSHQEKCISKAALRQQFDLMISGKN